MAEDWHSSGGISLEILVHTSARVTDAEDALYRQQGTALIEYMNYNPQQANIVDEPTKAPVFVQQTPVAPEVLVPQTKSELKSKASVVDGSIVAIAASFPVAAESQGTPRQDVSANRSGGSLPKIIAQSFRSATTSTASIREESSLERSPAKRKAKRHPSRNFNSKVPDSIWQDPFSPVMEQRMEPIPSPDSAKFKLQSPRGYRIRKRELDVPLEEPRPVDSRIALIEQSPNKCKRQHIQLHSDSPHKDTSLLSPELTRVVLQSNGWLSSIAQLTSSSNASSMPKVVLSAEIKSSEPNNAFLAPWPASGHELYTSHLVGTLALVAGSQRLCAAYRPKEIKREIDPLERGYWHLKIPYSWSSADQDGFWEMLEEMIVEGKCGWGNWVEHVIDSSDGNNAVVEAEDPLHDLAKRHVSEIKVWCWGEVVREIWLSLLMASRRQTLRLGMTWYDSCGNVVVQMR